MKKFYILALLSALVVTASAQDESPALTSKRGYTILPQAGEWGLGVSADPFLFYMGNFFHGLAQQGSPNFNFPSNPANSFAVMGKLMIDENSAYRVRFNGTINTTINKSVVDQNQLNPDPIAPPAFTEDWQKIHQKNFVLTAGYEKRRGSSRVQGVYGGELVFGLSNTRYEYQYGNPISLEFQTPNTANFGNNFFGDGRVTEEKTGVNLLVGARGFIGVEYFIAPKVSIGGEFGYMFAFRNTGRALVTYEQWDPVNQRVREFKEDYYYNNGTSYIGFGLDNLSGSINLMFYF